MQENEDQRALRKWIEHGLSIPEVRELKGDSGYLLNNMIAKYTLAADQYSISELALEKLKSLGFDPNAKYKRRTFYGKKSGENPFIYEHAVPVTIVRNHLLSNPYNKANVKSILSQAGVVAMILRSEDAQIREKRLTSKMPDNWHFGHDPLARYNEVGIKLSTYKLRVSGAICR